MPEASSRAPGAISSRSKPASWTSNEAMRLARTRLHRRPRPDPVLPVVGRRPEDRAGPPFGPTTPRSIRSRRYWPPDRRQPARPDRQRPNSRSRAPWPRGSLGAPAARPGETSIRDAGHGAGVDDHQVCRLATVHQLNAARRRNRSNESMSAWLTLQPRFAMAARRMGCGAVGGMLTARSYARSPRSCTRPTGIALRSSPPIVESEDETASQPKSRGHDH